MDFQIGQQIELTISGTTHEGYGVGKKDGFVFFVPFCAVGETVLCTVSKLAKTYGEATLFKVIKPSPERTTNDCPYFTECGGCVYRHITYKEELRIKTQLVQDNLLKIGKLDFEVPNCVPSPRQNYYRNNCQTPFEVDERGKIYSGFQKKNSHELVNTKHCLLEPPIFNEIRQAICKFLNETNISIYNKKSHKGLMRSLFLRCGKDAKQIYVTLMINGNSLPNQKKFVAAITKQFPQITGITLNHNTNKNNSNLSGKNTVIFGKSFLQDTLAGITLNISPNAFYQVNRQSAENLYKQVSAYAAVTKDDIVVDLYCGTGSIGLSLANRAREIIGVDIISQSVENAKQNALQNNITNARFLCSDATKAAIRFENEGLKPNVIITDPPRKGCDTKLLNSIVKMNPQCVVMVSCNAATLARDLKYLTENNYVLKELQPFDLFPRTSHIEVVALLLQIK